LLLCYLADDSVAQVHRSSQSGDLFALRDAAGGPRAIALAITHADSVVELPSVAVAPELQRQGFGRQLLAPCWTTCGSVGPGV
jgi:GNAT superfamily N-acetyltransferase